MSIRKWRQILENVKKDLQTNMNSWNSFRNVNLDLSGCTLLSILQSTFADVFVLKLLKKLSRNVQKQNAGVEKAARIFGFYSFSACKKASKWIGWSYRQKQSPGPIGKSWSPISYWVSNWLLQKELCRKTTQASISKIIMSFLGTSANFKHGCSDHAFDRSSRWNLHSKVSSGRQRHCFCRLR